MFLAWRDLVRSWRRFLLVGLVVALVAVLSTVLVGLANGLVTQGISGLRALPLDHLAFQTHSEAVFSRSTLNQQTLSVWQRAPGVKASPVGVSFVNAAGISGEQSLDLALFGVPADSFLVERADARQALSGAPGLVLTSDLEGKGVKIGDRYRLGGSDVVLPVLGFTYGGFYGHVAIAFTSLRTWQSITYGSDARGRYSAIALQVPKGTDVVALDRAAGTEVKTKVQAYQGAPGFSGESQSMTLIRGFLLAISALIVGAFFTVLTVQRTRQIGLLKALGASGGYVVRDALGQIAVLVVIATVVGAAVGAGITALLQGGAAPIELTLRGVLVSSGLLVVTGILGSCVALRRIAKVEPIIALGVEG